MWRNLLTDGVGKDIALLFGKLKKKSYRGHGTLFQTKFIFQNQQSLSQTVRENWIMETENQKSDSIMRT